MIIALLHIIGSIFVLFLIVIISGAISERSNRKKTDEVIERAAIELGLKRADVFDGKHDLELARYLSERYSDEKFVNRLSDLFRPLLILLEFVSYLTQLSLVLLAIWQAITIDMEFARNAWAAVPFAFVFIILNYILFWLCYLLTGRANGEARGGRRIASELIADD